MKTRCNQTFIGVIIGVIILSSLGKISTAKGTNPLSPAAMCIDQKHNYLIVAHKTGKCIHIIDINNNALLGSVEVPIAPKALVYNGDDLVYVASSYSQGMVYAVNIVKRKIVESIEVGFGACSLVLSPDKKMLYVGNQFSNDVSVVNLQKAKEINRIKVLRQPMAIDVSPDGQYLYVANYLPATRADIDTVSAEVSIIDSKSQKVIANIGLANGSNALHGLKVSPDGNYVFISHNLGRFQVPTSQLEQGWMNTSALSVINAQNQKYVATVLLDEPGSGAANPWGIDINHKYIVIAHAATHEVSLIPYNDFIAKLENTGQKQDLSYRLDFLTDIRRRIPINGEGPRAILVNESSLYTALYFSDAIQKINIDVGFDEIESSADDLIVLNPEMHLDSARLGEMYFHDARQCFQQWQSCASCHPDNGRVDALNWDLLNDGIGNPKNCKSLLLSHQTPPSMISGIRPTAEIAVRAGFRHIQFAQVDENVSRAVDLYLQSLKAIPSPHLENGQLNEKAKQGKKDF